MLAFAGLGLVVAMAPSLIVPRYGLNGYLLVVAVSVVLLVAVGLRAAPRGSATKPAATKRRR